MKRVPYFLLVLIFLLTSCGPGGDGDATATQYLNAVAGHYGSSGDYSGTWTQANSYGKALWGSEEETDEGSSGIGAAMSQAGRLHYALAGGSASAWIGWTNSEWTPGDEYTRAPHWIWFGAKHFFRFVRPGAKRIGCSGGSGSLQVSAYHHTGDATYTVVVVNTGGAATIRLQGTGLPTSWNMWQTDATRQCVSMGSVNTSSNISIPGTGIVTLYSGAITQIYNQGRTRAPTGMERVRAGQARVFSLDGRLARGSATSAVSAAVRVLSDRQGTKRELVVDGAQR